MMMQPIYIYIRSTLYNNRIGTTVVSVAILNLTSSCIAANAMQDWCRWNIISAKRVLSFRYRMEGIEEVVNSYIRWKSRAIVLNS